MFRPLLVVLYLVVVAVLFVRIYEKLPVNRDVKISKTRDVFHIYTDASILARGENPYQRIQGKDMKTNEKYTFYLPGFLWAAAAGIKYFGIDSYQEFMQTWIPISVGVHFLIGLVLFLYAMSRWGIIPGILASSFWWFTRWPLALLRSGQIDNVAILFFVIALVVLERQRLLGLVMLGVSLCIKQMAAFTVPLFLVWPALNGKVTVKRALDFGIQIGALCAVPLILSLPFIYWDIESFINMLLFPLTRDPVGPMSLESFLDPGNQERSFLFKLPFLSLLALSYLYLVRQKEFLFPSILFILLLFLGFNSVFFSRYFCWAIPLIPLACFECLERVREDRRDDRGYSC